MCFSWPLTYSKADPGGHLFANLINEREREREFLLVGLGELATAVVVVNVFFPWSFR